MDIIKGHIYRAKHPRNSGGLFNDRQVRWVDDKNVQYDSPTVKGGNDYPTIRKEKFLEWAGEDVTDGYPKGVWAEYQAKGE